MISIVELFSVSRSRRFLRILKTLSVFRKKKKKKKTGTQRHEFPKNGHDVSRDTESACRTLDVIRPRETARE